MKSLENAPLGERDRKALDAAIGMLKAQFAVESAVSGHGLTLDSKSLNGKGIRNSKLMPHARRAPSNHENAPGVLVRVTVTKPVSFRAGRLRELLKTRNVTE